MEKFLITKLNKFVFIKALKIFLFLEVITQKDENLQKKIFLPESGLKQKTPVLNEILHKQIVHTISNDQQVPTARNAVELVDEVLRKVCEIIPKNHPFDNEVLFKNFKKNGFSLNIFKKL